MELGMQIPILSIILRYVEFLNRNSFDCQHVFGKTAAAIHLQKGVLTIYDYPRLGE